MDKTIYEITQIAVKTYDPRQNHITFDIIYLKNGTPTTITKEYLFDDAANFVKKVINEVKKKDDQEQWDDNDPLAGYQVVDLKNQEETEEKLLNFVHRIHEKQRLIKRMKDAKKYMQMFDELKTAKTIIA